LLITRAHRACLSWPAARGPHPQRRAADDL